MFSIMTDTADILIDNLDRKAESGDSFDIYSTFQCLTLDVIGRCAFGLRTDAQTDPNDPFLNNIRTLFNTLSKTLILPLVSEYNCTVLLFFLFNKGKYLSYGKGEHLFKVNKCIVTTYKIIIYMLHFNHAFNPVPFCLAVFLPFLSHVVFFIKNLVVIFGMNPVVWLREQMKEVITIRKEMGVSFHKTHPNTFLA